MKTRGQEDMWMKQVPRSPKCRMKMTGDFLKKKKKFIYLAAPGVSCGASCGMLDLSVVTHKFLLVARVIYSLTRDQTHSPCTGSAKSQPLGYQRRPMTGDFKHSLTTAFVRRCSAPVLSLTPLPHPAKGEEGSVTA